MGDLRIYACMHVPGHGTLLAEYLSRATRATTRLFHVLLCRNVPDTEHVKAWLADHKDAKVCLSSPRLCIFMVLSDRERREAPPPNFSLPTPNHDSYSNNIHFITQYYDIKTGGRKRGSGGEGKDGGGGEKKESIKERAFRPHIHAQPLTKVRNYSTLGSCADCVIEWLHSDITFGSGMSCA